MAESFFERRKRELGITDPGKASTQGSTFFERRKQELGLVPPPPSEPYKQSLSDLERNAARADINLSPIESAKVRSGIENQQSTDYQTKYDKLPKFRKMIVDFQKTPVGKFLVGNDQATSDFLHRGLGSASLGATDAADKALINSSFLDQGSKDQIQTMSEHAKNSAAGKVGEVAGYLVPGAGAERASAALLKPVLRNAPKVVSGLARGLGAGAIFGVADETGQALTGQNDQTLGERAMDVGIQTAAGGVLGGLSPVLGKLFSKTKLGKSAAGEVAASGETLTPLVKSVDEAAAMPPVVEKTTDLLANSDAWKNKAKLALKRETMTRNFEDIMGKDAPKMQGKYLTPIKESEATRQRFIKAEKAQIKDLGIKYKSNEDQLVQKYGEGLISLDDLKKETPSWQKVVDATDTFRKKYDEFLTKANQVLERNGYKPIPKRENYFPHYREIDNLLSKFGIRLENTNLPTDINGLSADFKPGKNFFAHALQRKGNKTTFGALEGYDRYIEGISRLIHHTDNIKGLRGLEKDIRKKYEGDTHLSNFVSELTDYTNNLAGKKSGLDRSAEELVGRNIYSAVDAVRRRVSTNMVVGSLSSALSNTIALPQALATTGKKAFLEGMFDTLKGAVKGDGFAEKSRFLSARDSALPLAMGKIARAQDKAMILFKAMDHFTSETVVRGKYNELLAKGLNETEAMKQADEYASRLIGDRSLGSAPTLFNSKVLGLVTQFQLEVNNQLSFLFKDLPRSMSKTKFASAITQVAIYDFLFNSVYEKVTGQRPAFDPLGIAFQAYQDYTNPKLDKNKAGSNLFGNIAQTLPFSSIYSGGRIPLQTAIPNVNTVASGLMNGTEGWKDEALKPLYYVGAPFGGGQIKKTVTAAGDLGLLPWSKKVVPGVYSNGKDGDYLKYPVSADPINKTRGLLFGRTGFKETDKFYRNDQRALSASQTQLMEKSSNPKETYGTILKNREIDKLNSKAAIIAKDPNLSNEEKIKKIQGLAREVQSIIGR